jgi:hypothetical protein
MMQTWQAISGNQFLAQEVGAATILKGMEEAAKLGGAPKDFKLELAGRPAGENPEGQGQGLEQVASQIQESTLKQASELMIEQVVKPAAEAMAKQQEQLNALNQEVDAVARGAAEAQVAIKKLSEIVQMAMGAAQPPPQPAIPPYVEQPVVTDPNATATGIVPGGPPQMAGIA